MVLRSFGAFLLIGGLTLSQGLQQCGGGEDTPTPDPMAGENTTVVAFDGVHQFFGSSDTRTISAEVDFPDAQWHYENVSMSYTLSCPDGGCDPWDRLAYVTVVDEESGDAKTFEIGRFITPYGVGGSWTIDVTDLRPVLSGHRTVKSFIDTWVEPGWLVDVSFGFTGGTPPRDVLSVEPLWFNYVAYGNPDNPPADQLEHFYPQVPAEAAGASLRVFATGHGFGATENCAEFCQKEHTLFANGNSETAIPWRNDCLTAGVDGQSGTFWYSRAGWCPGDDVEPRSWDFSSLITPGTSVELGYGIQDYVNYEADVAPYWVISANLIFYR